MDAEAVIIAAATINDALIADFICLSLLLLVQSAQHRIRCNKAMRSAFDNGVKGRYNEESIA
jgi:hypothetical protein